MTQGKMMVKIPWVDLEDAIVGREEGLGNPGFCLACGEPANGCEPDARKYTCETCGANAVYGAEEILLMGAYEDDESSEEDL